MSTPPGPKTQGASPSDGASRPSLEQTFLGVAPAPRPPADVVAPPAPAPARPSPASASPPTPARDAIVAAPVIAVSNSGVAGSASAAPITPRVTAQPVVPGERAAPAAGEVPRSAPASEQTLMHPVPRAAAAPAPAPAARSPFPKPEPYAVPPRAGDAARLGGADRTALSSDYLRAAREAALGRGGSFRTQQSIGSEPPPRAPLEAAPAHRPPAAGTLLEAQRGRLEAPALPELPKVPPSERSPASGAPRFEPVPAARTHLSERGAAALPGQSLAHISVDWSPQLAEHVRNASTSPRSRAARWLLLGVGALVLVALGFITLGGPLRRVVARVTGRALATDVERAPETSSAPSVTTLSNQPAGERAPAGNAEPGSGQPRPAP